MAQDGALIPGAVRSWDLQADMFRGEYRLVEDLGGGRWLIEELPPSDELVERVLEHYTAPGAYLGYVDPFGPGRRIATADEAVEREIRERRDRAGERTEIRHVSRDEYARHF